MNQTSRPTRPPLPLLVTVFLAAFCWLAPALEQRLREAGAGFYPWPGEPGTGAVPEAGARLCRFVTSYRTMDDEIEALARAIR